jgi:SAM-dependent methyltransferase
VAAARLIDQDYLRGFHQHHAGITEAVLARATSGGKTPYQWLAEVVTSSGPVLDLACGNAPMRRALPAGVAYLGVDRSAAELAAARASGVQDVVCADADRLPVPDSSIDTVVCSMALMILEPFDAVLAEIRRVLRPGGMFAATVPVEDGAATRAAALLGRILIGGGSLPRSPNTAALADVEAALARHGLRLTGDERRRFAFPVRRPADARLLLDSLYLPGLSPTRRRLLFGIADAAALFRPHVPVPIRRLTAAAVR